MRSQSITDRKLHPKLQAKRVANRGTQHDIRNICISSHLAMHISLSTGMERVLSDLKVPSFTPPLPVSSILKTKIGLPWNFRTYVWNYYTNSNLLVITVSSLCRMLLQILMSTCGTATNYYIMIYGYWGISTFFHNRQYEVWQFLGIKKYFQDEISKIWRSEQKHRIFFELARRIFPTSRSYFRVHFFENLYPFSRIANIKYGNF